MEGLFRSLVLAETHLVKLSWEPHAGTVAALAHKLRMELKGSFLLTLTGCHSSFATKALLTPPTIKRMKEIGELGERKGERKRIREEAEGRDF